MLPTDCVRTSSAPCTTTAPQENEYEIYNRHPFAHDIDCHNRCGCAGWKRAWSSERAYHRHATADTCPDDDFAGRVSVEAFPAQVTISFNDEIAPIGVAKRYAAFRSVSEAHISGGRDEVPGRERAQERSRTGCARVGGIGCRHWRAVIAPRTSRHAAALRAPSAGRYHQSKYDQLRSRSGAAHVSTALARRIRSVVARFAE